VFLVVLYFDSAIDLRRAASCSSAFVVVAVIGFEYGNGNGLKSVCLVYMQTPKAKEMRVLDLDK
jgi:hypothetical protein